MHMYSKNHKHVIISYCTVVYRGVLFLYMTVSVYKCQTFIANYAYLCKVGLCF